MTIGIGVSGRNAGFAALRGLEAVEACARGMLGGFVSLAVIARDGRLLRGGTQRGGVHAIRYDGVEGPMLDRECPFFRAASLMVPLVIATAERAVLISSGPDRAEPLSQFAPGDPAVGLVTGHRLPNMPGSADQPLAINLACLEQMRAGADPAQAVSDVLTACPAADAGLIAVACNGRIGIGNSALVDRRSDAGGCLLEQDGIRIGVLHNSIFPTHGLAALAAGAALDAIEPADAADFTIRINAGTPLEVADVPQVMIDAEGVVTRLQVGNPGWGTASWQGAAAMRDTCVLDANGQFLGRLVTEAYCLAQDGKLLRCNGQLAAELRVRAPH